MRRINVPLRIAAIAAAGVVLATVHLPGQVFTGVSLKISKELVPPGGIAQMKVFVTEPKPISTGGGRLSFDGLEEAGIALISPADDTFGVAVLDVSSLDLSILSTTSSFGTSLDYPVLTVAARTPATAPLGTRFPVRLDPATLRLFDALGNVYVTEIKNGFAKTANTVSIDDVRPGSADLPAGAVVKIFGTGFVPQTEIRFGEVKLSSTTFVNSNRIDVVLASAARMHGMRIRAINPDGSRVTYYSYQRTARVDPSLVVPFSRAVPLFPHVSTTAARIDLSGAGNGLALQNTTSAPVTGRARLFAANGDLLAAVNFSMPAFAYLVKETSEIFHVAPPDGGFVRVTSSAPLQAMGVAVDGSGATTPVPPS